MSVSRPGPPPRMRLVVVTSVIHYRHQGGLYAYGPYAQKMGLWAGVFDEIVFAAPCRDAAPPGDCLPLPCPNTRIAPQPEIGGKTLKHKLAYLWWLPAMIWQLGSVLRAADAILVRCPGNMGLLGAVLAPLFSRRLVARFAGQWVGFPGEPFTVALQRRILASWWWRGPVMVYGDWPNSPRHVVPTFASILREKELRHAKWTSERKSFSAPVLNIVYVGRLSRQKKVHVILEAIAQARLEGAIFHLTIIGDGPERDALGQLAIKLGLADAVRFTGGVSHAEVLAQLELADILTLVSESEGWPKAIVEGMAFGLNCIGSNRGLMPQILAEGRGYVVAVDDSRALSDTLRHIEANRQVAMLTSQAAARWASQFSMEKLQKLIHDTLNEHWGLELPFAPRSWLKNIASDQPSGSR